MKTSRFDSSTIDVDQLKGEFNRFRDEVLGMKEKFNGNAAEVLDQVSAYLNTAGVTSRLSALEAEFEVLGGRLKDRGREAVSRVETEVGAKPIASLAIAFGLGLLASSLLRRK
jgi:ElaB/YqjD/DUF883 family membrane-anchored ribosome-binding protein